ncbi:MAG TPA: hypothetical protein VFD33_07440 [Bacillota bacterium]|nr:hypothetical protein [Bacillota bacterium]
MYIEPYIAMPMMVFAVFGIIYLIYILQRSLGRRRKKQKGIYTVLVSAKDREEDIEGIVRDFILHAKMDDYGDKLLNIILLDLGSEDDTKKIMERLARKYSIIKLIKPEEATSYIESLVYDLSSQ